jgi:hypothetical protein
MSALSGLPEQTDSPLPSIQLPRPELRIDPKHAQGAQKEALVNNRGGLDAVKTQETKREIGTKFNLERPAGSRKHLTTATAKKI